MRNEIGLPGAAPNAGLMAQARQRPVTYGLLAILALALLLRIWGIAFGLPYDLTPDEPHEILRALKLGAGEYSWFPGKGGLYYFLFIEYGVLFVVLWLFGRVQGPTEFALLYIQDPTLFYLAGRLTVAAMGAFTCLIVYWIGRELYGWRAGLVAAVLGAAAYGHAELSHYINVDVGTTLFVWASILAYIHYEKNHQLRWLIGAGVLGAVAFAFKLPGIVAVGVVMLAIATPLAKWSEPWTRIKEGAVVAAAALVTTAVIAPENIAWDYIVYNFSSLIGTVAIDEDAAAVADIEVAQFATDTGATYLRILTRPVYLGVTLAAAVGGVMALLRRDRWGLIITVFVVGFLVVMSMGDRLGSVRYLLPIVPGLWLLAARGATGLTANPKVQVALVAAIVAYPLFAIVRKNHTWTRPDTRIMAKEWIETNVPSGAKILMDGLDYRFIQSPPLNPDDVAVARRVADAGQRGDELSRGVSNQMLELYAKAMDGVTGPRYDLHSTGQGRRIVSLSHYVEACFDYVVTSSHVASRFERPAEAARFPQTAEFYKQIPVDPRYELVYSAHPEPWRIQGPDIAVYRVAAHCAEDLHSTQVLPSSLSDDPPLPAAADPQ